MFRRRCTSLIHRKCSRSLIHKPRRYFSSEQLDLAVIGGIYAKYTTNSINDEADRTDEDVLQIEWKGMDGYSLDVREAWIINNDILFLCFNRVNRLSWMILQALHDVCTQFQSKQNIKSTDIPIYIVSTCSDLYLSQTTISHLESIDLVSFKEVEEYVSKFDNVFHYETSAKMQYNIDTIFKAAVTKYDELHPRKKKKRKRKKSMSQASKHKTPISQTKNSPKPPKQSLKVPNKSLSPQSPVFNAEPVFDHNNTNETKQNNDGSTNDNVKEVKIDLMETNPFKEEITQSQQKIGSNIHSILETKEEQISIEKQENIETNTVDIEQTQSIELKHKNENEQSKVVESEPLLEEDKETEQKLRESEPMNGYNNNNGYESLSTHMQQLSMSPSLSAQDMYSIEYSTKYTESQDFADIQKTFSKYHQIKVFYEEQTQFQLNSNQYKASCLLFFKDLDATLTTIGCIDSDKKLFFINCKQHIIFKMSHTINICKSQYEYLAKITLLTGEPILKLESLQKSTYWNKLSDASFVSKLEMGYDEWMANHTQSENEFKNEISGALHINPIYIQINGVGRGMSDIVIDWTVMYIWIPYYIQGVESNLIYREYRMRCQDQIEVCYKKEWIPCTILEVKDTLNKKGKQIKVRYNKLNGTDRFISNTEWLWTVKQYQRLRLPDQVFVTVSYNGIKISTTFKPLLLAYCRNGKKELIRIGQHIFVSSDGVWYRCEVINRTIDGHAIQVLYLVNTFVKNTEWLRLDETEDLERISLEDMRTM